jgi:TonB family protein
MLMFALQTAPAEVFTFDEVARAAGVSRGSVDRLVARGGVRIVDGGYLSRAEAMRAVRALADPAGSAAHHEMFSPTEGTRRTPGLPIAVSSAIHAAIIGFVVLSTTLGLMETEAAISPEVRNELMRMVFLNIPGPGGGGGGGGLRQKAPPPKAERKGERRLSSPLPERRQPEPIRPVPQPIDPPKPTLEHEPLPPLVVPIATAPADGRDRVGVLEETTAQNDSRGPGTGGGAGSGSGTGLGEGEGPGVGPGSGGGTGGGPYRPGSGISPPRLLREVKPDYTEEARQRGVEGDVLLEIVVRRDGTVGEVKLLEGLGAGLDQRAVQAVRQWRFEPARRQGAPVDVMVEVAVEFKLR